jgi:hypothetical protein
VSAYAAELVASANVSNVKIDGKVIPGLQAIDYKVTRSRQNVHQVGAEERLGVDYGSLIVTGALRIRSTYPDLDKNLLAEAKDVKAFQLVVELKKGPLAVKTLSFDDCYLEDKTFALDANGVGISVYTFTATRLRESP